MIRNSHLMARCLLFLLGVSICLLVCPRAFAGTYYIASYGSDSNAGTSKTAAWLHAPGMPNCTANCAAKQTSKPQPSDRFIFRGGDTWHFGKAGLATSTGGQWNALWTGSLTGCTDESNQSGCIYWGVDKTWYTGSGWSRPVLDGDNPLSTALVASCAYQTAAPSFVNSMVLLGSASIFDNFEMRGLCSEAPNSHTSGASQNSYLVSLGTGQRQRGMTFQTNLYIHGWTATSGAGSGDGGVPVGTLVGGANGLQTIDHVVVDGSDSMASLALFWGNSYYHLRYSVFRYVADGLGQWCHDVHDNIFEHYDSPIHPTHGNIFKCNFDGTGDAPNQPQKTPNVFYNNIVRHATRAYSVAGNVKLWFCPTDIPEYWFNNVEYDVGGPANFWAIAGPTGYSCSNAGGQFMFNNTLVDGQQPCHLSGSNVTGGRYLTVFNEHLINSPWDGLGCQGRQSATNIAMSASTAASQGYVSSSGRINTQFQGSVSCANEGSKPCVPTKPAAATVGMGINRESYCTALAGYKSEAAISVDAANACRNGFTAPCSYDSTTHTMSCNKSAQAPRPASAAWDASAYQFLLTSTPVAPVVTSVTVQ